MLRDIPLLPTGNDCDGMLYNNARVSLCLKTSTALAQGAKWSTVSRITDLALACLTAELRDMFEHTILCCVSSPACKFYILRKMERKYGKYSAPGAGQQCLADTPHWEWPNMRK